MKKDLLKILHKKFPKNKFSYKWSDKRNCNVLLINSSNAGNYDIMMEDVNTPDKLKMIIELINLTIIRLEKDKKK